MAQLRLYLTFAATIAVSFAARTSTGVLPSSPHPIPTIQSGVSHMPLWFEPNVGQSDAAVPFIAKAENQAVFLRGSDAAIAFWNKATGRESLRMRFIGASPGARAEGVERLKSVSNYFLGDDPAKWRTHVPHFAKVRFTGVYPGIDVVYYRNGENLEYDFVVSPGADPSRIQLAYEGGRLRVDDAGNLRVALHGRDFVQRRPRVYQQIGKERIEVAARYRISQEGTVQLALAPYNRSKSLVIDPVLDYSVYLGGKAYDTAIAITVDTGGNKYVTGTTGSADLVSNSQFQDRFGGATDAYLAKFDAGGTLRYFTYLGGSNNDTGRSIVVDSSGSVYIGGDTISGNFPVPANHDPTNSVSGGSADVFVTKIAPAGDQLVYTRFIGGGSDDFIGGGPTNELIPGKSEEFGNGMAVDTQGNAYITGYTKSTDFPTVNPFMTRTKQGGESAFVTKINPSGSALLYSTVIEGNGKDGGEGIALDSAGNIYVTGYTTSTNFPTVGPIQPTNRSAAGYEDIFLLKLNPATNRLVYSTYLGGLYRDLGFRIAVDGTGAAYITGYTQSSDFPTRAAVQPLFGGGNYDAFVTKVSPDGASLVYSTFVGGLGDDWGFADIAVDVNGNVYVGGYTTSTNLPVVNAFQPAFGLGDTHGFVGQLNSAGSAWAFLSYYGGSKHDEIHGLAFDPVRGTINIAGFTSSPNLPSAKNAFVGDLEQGRYDAFIAQIGNLGTPASTLIAAPSSLTFSFNAGAGPQSQTIQLTSSSNTPLQFTVANSNPSNTWLSFTTSATTTPAQLTVTVDPRTLGGGPTSGELTVNVVGGSSPIRIPILVGVTSAPVISSITPNTIAAGSPTTTITVSGSGFTSGATVSLNGAAAQTQFDSPNSLRATVPASLLANPGTISVTVFSGGSNSAAAILTVASGLPVISAAQILNAASNLPGAIAPGEIITIKGTGFGPSTLTLAEIDTATGGLKTTLAGTRVLINTIPAPLVYATTNQVSAIVPYSVTFGSAAVVVEYQGQRSAPALVDLALASPAIFTADSTGRGAAVAFNQDGSQNSPSNPADKGTVITFFATGEGLVNPAGVTGSLANPSAPPKPVQDVKVKVNGIDAEVTYAGAVPNLVLGLLQVNARIPQSAPSGSNIPLVLQVGGLSSPFVVTVSIR